MNTASCRQVNLIMVYLLPSKKYFGMKKLQIEAQIIKIPILPIKWTYLKHYSPNVGQSSEICCHIMLYISLTHCYHNLF